MIKRNVEIYISPDLGNQEDFEQNYWPFDYAIYDKDTKGLLAYGEEFLEYGEVIGKTHDEICKSSARKIYDNLEDYLNKPLLKDCCRLLQYCVAECRASESGMFFLEKEDIADYFEAKDLEEFEKDCDQLELFKEGVVEYGGGDALFTCYIGLPEMFNLKGSTIEDLRLMERTEIENDGEVR